eukprot:6085335-Alexandrium_andersonii.AAC.1
MKTAGTPVLADLGGVGIELGFVGVQSWIPTRGLPTLTLPPMLGGCNQQLGANPGRRRPRHPAARAFVAVARHILREVIVSVR